MFAMFFESPVQIALIAFAVIVLFGAKKLPELGRSLGQGIKEFKHASKNLLDDDSEKERDPASEGKA
jgi:sec-independent protein translocase protein TatA